MGKKTDSYQFKTETKKLLDIVIHSLYSHREIFLRELISNSADAINRLKFLALTETEIIDSTENFQIEIIPNKQEKSLIIRDNGIGMTKQELIENLGTIARSGTKKYLEVLAKKDIEESPELIGQFGVGFYSAFMVSDKIEVISRSYSDENTYKWSSSIEDYSFQITPSENISRGTEVKLYLNDQSLEYLEEFNIRSLVKKYSDYIEYPIQLICDKKPEKINSQRAIWLANKDEVTEQEYKDFYQSLSYDFNDPLTKLHYRAEGTHEFSVLVFIPSHRPLPLMIEDLERSKIDLYVRRVLIVNQAKEILPRYLRFVTGVVDSSDLPLNISRELLQQNLKVVQIRKNLVRKILDELLRVKRDDPENYRKFFDEYGLIIKEGLLSDQEYREQILNLLTFQSTRTESGRTTDLEEYVSNMPQDQKEIYFIISENRNLAENSPALEVLKSKKYEVLFLQPGIDEIIMNENLKYKDYSFRSATDESLEISKSEDFNQQEKEIKGLLEFIQDQLKDDLKEVRLSNRLIDSPVCFVQQKGSFSPELQRVLQFTNQNHPPSSRIMEINAKHPLIENIEQKFNQNRSDPELIKYIHLLLDLALIQDGERPKNPVDFANQVANLMNSK